MTGDVEKEIETEFKVARTFGNKYLAFRFNGSFHESRGQNAQGSCQTSTLEVVSLKNVKGRKLDITAWMGAFATTDNLGGNMLGMQYGYCSPPT